MSRQTCPWTTRGLTLVEMVISMVLMAVMVVAALNTVGAAKMGQHKLYDRRQGHALAESLMDEILGQSYADASQVENLKSEILVNGKKVTIALGPESGETDSGNRSAFDDVDDYHGWIESPPKDKQGAVMSDLVGWRRSVTVEFVKDDDAGIGKTQDEGSRRITVSVTHDDVPVAELVALRTLGPIPTEACCLPDGTALDMLPTECLALGGTAGGPGSNALNTPCGGASALVANWKMDEGSGTTATDGVNGFTAQLLKGLTWTNGHSGKALSFDGSNDYAEIPHDDRLSLTGEMTVAAWIYKKSNSSWDVALSKGTVDPHHNYSLATNGNKLVFEFHDGTQYWHSTSSFSLSTNTWYHVAVTYDDAANTVKIYRNGALQNTLTCLGSLLPNNDPLRFGECTSNCCMWHGYLDEVYIYSRVLTDSEVQTLYNGGEPQ